MSYRVVLNKLLLILSLKHGAYSDARIDCCVKCETDHVNVSLAVRSLPVSVDFIRTSVTLYNCTLHSTYVCYYRLIWSSVEVSK